MSKGKDFAAVIISVIAICISAVSCFMVVSDRSTGDVEYVMYVGTNDKDTNEPVYPEEEAKEKVEEILVSHFGGYTIQEADGGWEDNGKLYQEYSLVVYLSDTDLESVHAAADELIKELNQTSVLIKTNKVKTEFYGG